MQWLVVGLVLGWKAAPYLDALDTALAEAMLVSGGVLIAAADFGKTAWVWVTLATYVLAGAAGIWLQFRAIARSKNRGKRAGQAA